MRVLLTLICVAGLSGVASAQTKPVRPVAKPAGRPVVGPKSIGKFEDWQAVTHLEAGQAVCYAFARVQASVPAVAGRSDVVLTVTQRPSGRDAVALSAGFAYAAGADVQMTVEKTELSFYTNARSAFARDGHAVTVAFLAPGLGARQAVVKSPGPKNVVVTDTFGQARDRKPFERAEGQSARGQRPQLRRLPERSRTAGRVRHRPSAPDLPSATNPASVTNV